MIFLFKNIIKTNKININYLYQNIKIIGYFHYGHEMEPYHNKIWHFVNKLIKHTKLIRSDHFLDHYKWIPLEYIKILLNRITCIPLIFEIDFTLKLEQRLYNFMEELFHRINLLGEDKLVPCIDANHDNSDHLCNSCFYMFSSTSFRISTKLWHLKR